MLEWSLKSYYLFDEKKRIWTVPTSKFYLSISSFHYIVEILEYLLKLENCQTYTDDF